MLLVVNPKGCEVEEHIATNMEVNPQMSSTLKNEKSIWIVNLGANFDTSMLVPLWILSASVKRHIGNGSSKSGRFVYRPFVGNAFASISNL